MKGILVLEDGSSFEGLSVGVAGERIGEVVLNTAVVGYQEMMTDPANAGKILILTYPLIGNYGVAAKFNESKRCWIGALVIKEASRIYSNWQAEDSFGHFLNREKVVAISEMDTRTLAIKIRDQGEMLGIVSTKNSDPAPLLRKLQGRPRRPRPDFISQISTAKISRVPGRGNGLQLGVLDLGLTRSLLKQLQSLAGTLWLLPHDTPAQKILSLNLDGLVISNGPEEDAAIPAVVKNVKTLLGQLPVLAVSTGHEALVLALGGKLKRLAVGHHGVNYPVCAPHSTKGEITVQNHSLVVDEDSIQGRPEFAITLRNLNDQTIEEMESQALRFISTQYDPKSPGFDELNPVFDRFRALIGKEKRS